MTLIRPLAFSILLLAAACTGPPETRDDPGPRPSPAAERLLLELYGQPCVALRGAPGGLAIAGFAVLPNPVSPGGKGPVVILEGPGGTHYLPVLRDADVADLYERVMGRPSGLPQGPLSAPYGAAIVR